MKKILFLSFSIFIGFNSFAQTKLINKSKKNIALQGYDVVSYFNDNPMEGLSTISSVHEGATYLFTNEKNKRLFEKAPENYTPQYGGWCAYAMGIDGSKVKINPSTYKIVKGKLYLFYNFKNTNTLDFWNKEESKLMQEADKLWANLIKG